jgi:hypothetical protein
LAAKKRKAGHKVVFVEVPEGLAERLKAVAEHNHRSLTGEAVVAFERHVKTEEARIRAEAQAETPEPKGKGKAKGGER